mmetsp:Transcript_30647/g.45363  ORF Transcript_30647/g.45363 Transcript_30647/m.45363 type:complete len:528 (-) Transcript_30647:267-1850(-)|eukprot:CAMPEP_0195524918 /NCGR_PEP_ID=MMETSP0794_2-20130614/25033_1 /TAXON_ID=515487 /ORGANISM="Stephanopyxis turris, Strain CCMP 815" /LENGTH=527 /DNA_ID=CAMNT_0040655243 /DNA_START=97 /DNA_END=1680 /DNA_ORIENTATION=-
MEESERAPNILHQSMESTPISSNNDQKKDAILINACKSPQTNLEEEEEAALDEVQELLDVVEDLLGAELNSVTNAQRSPVSPGTLSRSKLIQKRLGVEIRKNRARVEASLSKLRLRRGPWTEGEKTQSARRRRPQIKIDLGKHPAVIKTRDATRRAITGKADTKIRDFVVLPRVVRVLDKYTFTLGVMGIITTEFIMLEYPELFRYYYVAVMFPMLVLRYILYSRSKWHYFLLDFCYWVNLLCFILIVGPNSLLEQYSECLWQLLFICANGPLLLAIVLWSNSLVFHSVDKVTSVYVHILPALLGWCERWRSERSSNEPMNSLKRHVIFPILFYLIWQAIYLFQTEFLSRKMLDQDPEIATSLRWIAASTKAPITKIMLTLCRRLGIMSSDETFHPPTMKVKLIFVASQFIFTFVTFLPGRLLHRYEYLHSFLLLFMVTASVYNGAGYYIQVFSKIYEKRYSDEKMKNDADSTSTSTIAGNNSDFSDENPLLLASMGQDCTTASGNSNTEASSSVSIPTPMSEKKIL